MRLKVRVYYPETATVSSNYSHSSISDYICTIAKQTTILAQAFIHDLQEVVTGILILYQNGTRLASYNVFTGNSAQTARVPPGEVNEQWSDVIENQTGAAAFCEGFTVHECSR